jgi:hypothetical protein
MENHIPLRKGWLDHLAISMAVICGIHCLVTPVLLVALPILATTFWVDEHFHLWMLFLVIPTTTLAILSGCRRHKDKWVLAMAGVGVSLLVTALVAERSSHHLGHVHHHGHAPAHAHDPGAAHDHTQSHAVGSEDHGNFIPGEGEALLADESTTLAASSGSEGHLAEGGCCPLHPVVEAEGEISMATAAVSWHTLLNVMGGFILVLGHSRNFLLCRKAACTHD